MRTQRSSLLIVACVVSLGLINGCGPSVPNEGQRAAVNDYFGKVFIPDSRSPKATTIISFEQQGDWAHVIVADGNEPRAVVGQAFLALATGPDGNKWIVCDTNHLLLDGNDVVGFGFDSTEARPEDTLVKKWNGKWEEYIERRGYKFSEKNVPAKKREGPTP